MVNRQDKTGFSVRRAGYIVTAAVMSLLTAAVAVLLSSGGAGGELNYLRLVAAEIGMLFAVILR